MNIDGCRVETDDGYVENAVTQGVSTARTSYDPRRERSIFVPQSGGRWPANLIHDGSDEVVGEFPSPHPAGHARSGSMNPRPVLPGGRERFKADSHTGNMYRWGDSGSAARFFYCAKESDRDILAAEEFPLWGESCEAVKNRHPTVKPVALMQYLVRLVTPPKGVVLDPFMGSGSTGVAAMREGARFIGMELDSAWVDAARQRIAKEKP